MEILALHKKTIDIMQKKYLEIEITQGSKESIGIQFFILKNGEKMDMQAVKMVSFEAITENGKTVFSDVMLEEDESIIYKLSNTIMNESGKTVCMLQLIGENGETLNAYEFYVNTLPKLFDENQYVTDDDISAVRSYMLRAEKAAEVSEGVKNQLEGTIDEFERVKEELDEIEKESESYLDTVKERIESGEFIGAPGPQGKQGEQGIQGEQGKQGIQGIPGESGVCSPISGFYALSVDSETGDIYVHYPDGTEVPRFEMDEEKNVYVILPDGNKICIGNVAFDGKVNALKVAYDNSESGMEASNVQEAITELSEQISELPYLSNTVMPQMYGAKGDGVTDDTEAIRLARDKALELKKPLYFPSGTYLVHGTIQLFSYMQVIGSSEAIIQKIPAVTQNLTVAGTKGDTTVYVSDASAFTVGYDVYIGLAGWGNYSDTVGVITAIDTENNSITFKNYHRHSADDNAGLARNVSTDGVVSQSFGIFSTMRYDDSGDEIEILNLTFDGNKQSDEPSCYVLSPIHIDPYNGSGSNKDGMGLTVRDCIVKNCHADGISMQNMGRTTVDNCTILDAVGKGIHPGFKTTGVNISNCYVYNCDEGIYDCNTVRGLNINSCHIANCRTGIGGLDYTSHGSTITGCVIENCAYGIQSGAVTCGNTVVGCAFNECTNGIWGYVSGDMTVSGNTFYGCNAGVLLQRAYRMAINGNYFIDCTKAIDSGYQTSNPDIKGSHNIISNNVVKVSDESKKTAIMDIKYMTDSMITGNILIGENASINVDETTTSGIIVNNNIVGSAETSDDTTTEGSVYQDGDTLIIKSGVTVTQDSDTLIIE